MKTVAPLLGESAPGPKRRRLLDQVRDRIRVKHYSIRTEQTYVDWIKRYIVYFGKRQAASGKRQAASGGVVCRPC